jgi:type I restriction enzyme S subunit
MSSNRSLKKALPSDVSQGGGSDVVHHGWMLAQLSDITEIVMGQSPPSTTYNMEQRGLPFFQGKAEFGDLFPVPKKYCDTPVKIAEPDDILMSIRAPVGPTNLCGTRSCIGRGLAAIRAQGAVHTRYLLYYFRSIESWLSVQGTGSTFTAINKDDLALIRVPIPPIAEQRRIVAKLEMLLGKVSSSQQRLARIPGLLKRFRQSVLAAACSGKLTADWRVSCNVCHNNEFDLESLFEIPRTWAWKPLNAICDQSRGICYGVIKLGDELADGIPCLRTSDVKVLGINPLNVKRISPEISNDFRRSILQSDEILVNVRGTLGGVSVVPKEMSGWNVSREIAVVPVLDVVPHFVANWIATPAAQSWLSGIAKGVAYTGINLEDLRKLPVPLPPLPEQQEIVRRVEKLFAFADRIEARLKQAQSYVDRLTQSILAKAFRGELVPTEAELARREGRSYESASELLERIRVEFAKSNRSPKTVKRV